jgi:hypothetical protein
MSDREHERGLDTGSAEDFLSDTGKRAKYIRSVRSDLWGCQSRDATSVVDSRALDAAIELLAEYANEVDARIALPTIAETPSPAEGRRFVDRGELGTPIHFEIQTDEGWTISYQGDEAAQHVDTLDAACEVAHIHGFSAPVVPPVVKRTHISPAPQPERLTVHTCPGEPCRQTREDGRHTSDNAHNCCEHDSNVSCCDNHRPAPQTEPEREECGVAYPEDGGDLDGSFTICQNARPCDNHESAPETPSPEVGMSRDEHEACREIERAVTWYEARSGRRVRNIGISRNDDGSVTAFWSLAAAKETK